MRYSSDIALLPQNLIRISQEPEKLFKMSVKSYRRDLWVGAVFIFTIVCRDFDMEIEFKIDRWDTVKNPEVDGIIYLEKINANDATSGKHFYFAPNQDESVPSPFESDEYLTDSKWLFQKMVEFMRSYDNEAYIKHFENVPEYKIRIKRDAGSGPSQLFGLVENVAYLRT